MARAPVKRARRAGYPHRGARRPRGTPRILRAMASFRSHALAYRIRFDEAAPDGSMRPAALVRVLQDVAWRHTEAVGLGRTWYAERGVGWLARALDLELRAPLPHGASVTFTTDVTGWRRITCRRPGASRTPRRPCPRPRRSGPWRACVS